MERINIQTAFSYIIRQSPSVNCMPFGIKAKVDCLDITLCFIIKESSILNPGHKVRGIY
jgi:hypothetical protein